MTAIRVPIAKIEDVAGEPLRVFGWASVAAKADGSLILDNDDDVIPPGVLEAAAYDFVGQFGGLDVNHDGGDVGHVIESVMLTAEKRKAMGLPEGDAAWWVGFAVTDAKAQKLIKSGELKDFSIFGDMTYQEAPQ